MTKKVEKLLNISQAAGILGVHPLTVRNWTDKGYLPFYRTPGGHRRFRLVELAQFQQDMGRGPTDTGLVSLAQAAVREALAARRSQITAPSDISHQAKGNVLMNTMSEQQRLTMRTVGRDLLGLVIQYAAATNPSGDVTKNEEAVLKRGREIGRTYGQFAQQQGLLISELVETFNFFRDTIIDVTFSEQAAVTDGIDTSNPLLYRRLNHFMNEVLLATIQAIESEQ